MFLCIVFWALPCKLCKILITGKILLFLESYSTEIVEHAFLTMRVTRFERPRLPCTIIITDFKIIRSIVSQEGNRCLHAIRHNSVAYL